MSVVQLVSMDFAHDWPIISFFLYARVQHQSFVSFRKYFPPQLEPKVLALRPICHLYREFQGFKTKTLREENFFMTDAAKHPVRESIAGDRHIGLLFSGKCL
jgi:hypothetical protein